MATASKAASLLSVVALSAGSSVEFGHTVILHRAGFPEGLFNERPACGQRTATKSLLNSDYWSHVILGGFREGSCSEAGFSHFERTESSTEGPLLPFGHPSNFTFDVFSRDPNAMDVAACVARSCEPETAAILHSGYTREVVSCVRPALGACVPKAWACLGDSKCREAVKCVPKVAAQCGVDIMKVLSDKDERDKIMCIQECKGSKLCVVTKCGKAALSCFLGTDKLCHDVLHCATEGIATCSKDAAACLLSWHDGVCRENVMCLASGAKSCADPAVNALTDTSIADLVLCAHDKCPAVTALPELSEDLAADAIVAFQFPKYPTQLACMAWHCTGKLISLVADRDVRALTGCLPEALETCGPAVWECLGEEKCLSNFRCWSEGLVGATEDVWNLLTSSHEREFDESLVTCVADCFQDEWALTKVACLVGKCGFRAAGCLADGACRKLLEDFPVVAARCGVDSISQLFDARSTFSRTVRCGAHVAGRCGSEAVELIRDTNIASVVQCNSQCTHAPVKTDKELVVV